MKKNTSISFLLLISVLIINIVSGKKCSVDVSKIEEDHYYLVYVNNTHGEFRVFDDLNKRKRQESKADEFVFSFIDDVHNLIINNKDTYKDQEKFEEIENSAQSNSEYGKRFYNDDSNLIYPISSVDNTVVFNVYLSKTMVEELKKNKMVLNIEPDLASPKYQSYYNVDDILDETQWNGVSIRKNANLHLSLLSQGRYDKNIANKYDNNYYYPSSAGKGIDIIILDSGFQFNYSEFSNTDERTVKCVGKVVHGKFTSTDECKGKIITHGNQVADAAGGLVHGAANKANIYGIAHSTEYTDMDDSDAIAGLQRVYETMVRKNKTVISISYMIVREKDSSFSKQYSNLIDKITENGGIIIATGDSANVEIDDEENSHYHLPCSSKNTICVGGIDNESKTDITNVYKKARGSSYGRSLDIYAPFFVDTEIIKDGEVVSLVSKGCSHSTPLVAGVVATIMSDHPDIEFTKSSMLKYLLKNAHPFDINGQTSYFVNNGKHTVYSEDGIYNKCGNHPCDIKSIKVKLEAESSKTAKKATTTAKKAITTAKKATTTAKKVTTTAKKATTTIKKATSAAKKTTAKTANKKTTVKTIVKTVAKKTTVKASTNKKTTFKKTTNKKTTVKKTTNKKATVKKTTNKKTTTKKAANKKTTTKKATNNKNTKKV